MIVVVIGEVAMVVAVVMVIGGEIILVGVVNENYLMILSVSIHTIS